MEGLQKTCAWSSQTAANSPTHWLVIQNSVRCHIESMELEEINMYLPTSNDHECANSQTSGLKFSRISHKTNERHKHTCSCST